MEKFNDFVPDEMDGQVYEVSHYQETWETLLESGSESIECFKHLEHEENLKAIYLLPTVMMGSDYGGCSVNKSNHRVFLKEFNEDDEVEGILELYGSYGTYGIAIRLDVLKENEEMKECLKKLCDYPVIDEEDMSYLEMELQNEAWECFVKTDFENEIEEELEIDDVEEIDLDDEKVFNLFRYLEDKTNTYWIIETGCNAYIDIKRIMENFEEDFNSWKQHCIDEANGQKFLQLTS